MAVSAELTNWQVLPDGRIKVVWQDGHTNIYLDIEDIRKNMDIRDDNPQTAEELLLSWFLARSPDGGNPNLVNGKRLTFDLSAANPIRVQ